MIDDQLRTSWLAAPLFQVVARSEYQSLIAAIPQSTLFNEWDWLAASASHLDKWRQHLTLVVHRGRVLAACLPITWGWESIGGIPTRTLRPLGFPYADRVSLSARDPDALKALLAGLTSGPHKWDVLRLAELSLNVSQSDSLTEWATATGYCAHWRLTSHCPKLTLAPGIIPQPRRSNVRREVARRRRKLDESGTVIFRHYHPAPDMIELLLGELKSIEDQSWKGKRRLGVFSTEPRLRFFSDVLARFAREGVLLISDILIDQQRIGYCIGFLHRDTYLYYTPSYLPGFATSAIGRLLLDDLIRFLWHQGLAVFDASRTSLKDRHPLEDWDVIYTDHYDFQAFAKTPSGKLAYTMQHLIKPPLKKAWRQFQQSVRRRTGARTTGVSP